MHSTITNMAVYILAYKTYINIINEHISVQVYVTVNIIYLATGRLVSFESCIQNSLHNYKHITTKLVTDMNINCPKYIYN
jgi:hypothetical protein